MVHPANGSTHFPTDQPKPELAAGSRGHRVLVAEDDAVTLRILQKRLTVAGYTVLTARDGEEALAIFEEQAPSLILSDWMMPKIDGRELCSRIKATEAGRLCYFIILTARDKNEDIVEALDTGADEYLVKPCDAAELLARVRAGERVITLRAELCQANNELRNANKRINDEIQAVASIQRSLLPQALPERDDYRFEAHYRPSTECSGDFYDVLELPGGRLGLVMGDVSGHGGPAMVAMALARVLIRQTAETILDPAQFLARVNNEMFEHLPTEQYLTLFYAILTPETGELVYSSAGHNPPFLVSGEGENINLPFCEGFPIKLIEPDLPYDNQTITLERGQTLLCYTDGLPEAFKANGEMLRISGVSQFLVDIGSTKAEKIVYGLITRLEHFIDEHPMADDLTLMAIERQ